jgi:uncharacterized protein (TIGR02246 family)
MRRTLLCLLLCIFAVPALAQDSPTASPKAIATAPSDSDAIQQLEDDWLKAERTTDPAALDRILADDHIGVGQNGLTPSKAQLLKNFKAHVGQAPPYTVDTANMHIYVLGDDLAVAAYTKTYTAKENGNVAHEDITDVFSKDRGVWKLRISRSSFP